MKKWRSRERREEKSRKEKRVEKSRKEERREEKRRKEKSGEEKRGKRSEEKRGKRREESRGEGERREEKTEQKNTFPFQFSPHSCATPPLLHSSPATINTANSPFCLSSSLPPLPI